jgi:polysaccharide deacetylase family protein (PEP-CTERM system associated)
MVKSLKKHVILSLDVEEYFMSSHYDSLGLRYKWRLMESNILSNLDWVLSELDKYSSKITFFVLGIVAEKYPEVILEIIRRGHEVGLHGYNHLKLNQIDSYQFEFDLDKSLEVFSKIGIKEVSGYRAPSFSLSLHDGEKFNILKKMGFKYDSSIYPARYSKGLGEEPFVHNTGIVEIPLTSVEVLGFKFPIGGGFLRIYGSVFNMMLIDKSRHKYGPQVYLHPWEFDGCYQILPKELSKSFLHRVGTGNRARETLIKILQNYQTIKLVDVYRKFTDSQ